LDDIRRIILPSSSGKKLREDIPEYFGQITYFRISRLRNLLFTPFLGLFAAQFPDDALGAGLAVIAGVGAGPALVRAFPAIAVVHFIAPDVGVPPRVKAAFHLGLFPSIGYINRN
jgi:hypothetical protein